VGSLPVSAATTGVTAQGPGVQAAVETSTDRVAQNSLSEEIRDLSGGNGYTGLSEDSVTKQLKVLWKAPVPESVARYDGQVVDGMAVDVVEANYSEKDIVRASELLLSASRVGDLPPISFVTGSQDGSSLVIAVDSKVPGAERGDLPARARALTGMSASVVEGSPVRPASRQNDGPPWYGGGMMRHPGFNPRTTSIHTFSVRMLLP
jgi:hypothetical protein